jgi:hypothetical protein
MGFLCVRNTVDLNYFASLDFDMFTSLDPNVL